MKPGLTCLEKRRLRKLKDICSSFCSCHFGCMKATHHMIRMEVKLQYITGMIYFILLRVLLFSTVHVREDKI